ncbi:hypothetical protein SSX86_008043 [Deinandra increscens subsp. villosa]|uniref:RING-type domain-containing protein n=1 Tax=Deinandra increscens subsp. villosa TaxID=3103831 RepID=A0AAP0DAZ4_9ASTR
MVVDKSWLNNPNRSLTEYSNGLDSFLEMCKGVADERGYVFCPCNKCKNTLLHPLRTVKYHLKGWGFWATYKVWNYHGESLVPEVVVIDDVASGNNMGGALEDLMQVDTNIEEGNSDTQSSEASDDFDDLLKELQSKLYPGYGSSILTLIFITCIWLPFLQFRDAFLDILSFCYPQDDDNRHNRNVFPNIYRLSDLRFGDLQDADNGDDHAGSVIRSVDESCSICLAEFRDDDTVSQLSRCHHVFHACCIERWLDRDQFTCPICRSNVLCVSGKGVGVKQNSEEQFTPYWQW